MRQTVSKRFGFSIKDFIPAFSGLIGKISLISSFALVWAQELDITASNFVFENIRVEIIIGGAITLAAALLRPNTAPAGTLAPLIVLIPTMARFGVHPLVLSILVGIIGIVTVKTRLFTKLLHLSGRVSKASLALAFGVSGIVLCVSKLLSFSEGYRFALALLMAFLTLSYLFLLRHQKIWLIIPLAAAASFLIPFFFGLAPEVSRTFNPPNFSPFYWWNDMWGIGFGFNAATILKALPFALFVTLLWAADTLSIKAIIDSDCEDDGIKEQIDIDHSFIAVSIRNMAGGICGGAQTASLWRSFLIPSFMMNRPMRSSAIVLGLLGIIAGFTSIPVQVLAFPPLVWTVLLFGVFIPFIAAGLKGMRAEKSVIYQGAILLFGAAGVIFSPIFTWGLSFFFEKIMRRRLPQ